jgi:GNAT superfamily N-acetyltransferase
MQLRTATNQDLDDLATIACAAFPADPQWNYRFPHRREFPKDNFKCTRETYKSMLKEDGVVVNVITIDKDDDHQKHKPIALAVWELQYKKTSSFLEVGTSCGLLQPMLRSCLSRRSKRSAGDCDDRRDADPERMKAFDRACAKAKKEYFDDEFGDKQIHLRILATHPDYQRRGAGTRHCDWGLDLADEHKIPTTVLSSPGGAKLYLHLGFETLGHFTVQVDGEEDKLSIGAMIRRYENDEDEK